MSGLTPDDVAAFVQLFDQSDWDQLDIVVGDSELHLSKKGWPVAAAGVADSRPAQPTVSSARNVSQAAVVPERVAVPATESAIVASAGLLEVRAPHLGTFYRSPKPGEPPYVEIGQSVQDDSEVCMLEVMKLFTTMRAGVSGKIRKVCVADSALVESGQVLFLVEPVAGS